MMDEAAWLACQDPQQLLRERSGMVSERQLRLLVCASVRQVWRLLPTRSCRKAVEVAERFSDGRIGARALRSAQSAVDAVKQCLNSSAALAARDTTLERLQEPDVARAFRHAAWAVRNELWDASPERQDDDELWNLCGQVYKDACKSQCNLIRDVLGNPFRPTVIDRYWLDWNERTIPTLARTIYDERAFDRLPILADALQDAGGDNADLIEHCRLGGEHVRGCWVVDRLLDLS
jgi:hypothetical protein